ncbi:uncharacterized protein TRUGW13939_11815 [Talaromyces rugulosus]|uniref:inorganic diphosphatase n=1 Tax=Talaromyces rugulosus TaxID=121627 RepID=A0A7H8RDS6_TALRU|nr:uncharacterized protein TRUGW13939_11815 [Talaromyces rugulosus]QKX64640.1 hypothetical protein TRUGW13939_11815 [Talaromyces rugulosus]
MVVEIPRGTNEKLEIAKEVRGNPIEQDTIDGKPRRVAAVFHFKGYPCNYGAFPQTWEDPRALDPETNVKGDDDPLDAFLDQGETDWKVMVVDVEDPLATKLNNVSDIEAKMPGFLASLRN